MKTILFLITWGWLMLNGWWALALILGIIFNLDMDR